MECLLVGRRILSIWMGRVMVLGEIGFCVMALV